MAIESIFKRGRSEPDRLAAVFEGHQIAYGALARAVTAAARHLAAQALPRGIAVICADQLFDVCVLGLALRALGLTTLVIREAEDAAGLADLDIACLVTAAAESRSSLMAAAGAAGWRVIAFPAGLPAAEIGIDAMAEPGGHILMTSGATGAPKMVRIDPAAYPINHAVRRRAWGLTEGSLVNQFDFGGWTSLGHYAPLCLWDMGAAVVIATGEERRASMLRRDLTHAVMTPLFLAWLLENPPAGLAVNPELVLISSGGALAPSVGTAAKAAVSPRLYDGISCTEAGPFAFNPLDTTDDYIWKRVIPGREVRVLGDDDRPAPPGVVGRLGVRIIDGASGYLGDPRGAVGLFKDGFFYTGDLAVLGSDGRFALQGRASDVLNLGGHKTPAGPVEEEVRMALEARTVCLLQAPDGRGELRLHVVVESDRDVTAAALAAALADRLAETRSVEAHVLAELPRNHLGKVDRPALRRQLGLPA